MTEYGKSSPALIRCLVSVYSPVSGYKSRLRCCTLAGIAGGRRRGEWIDPAPSKIFVGEWLRWHGQQVQLKPSTLVRYDVAIRCQILPEWEGVPLSPVPTPTSGLARPVPATRIGCCRLFWRPRSRIVGWSENVAEGVPLPGVVRRKKRFLTHEHVEQLAEACAPYQTLTRVLAYAGLRWVRLRRCVSIGCICCGVG